MEIERREIKRKTEMKFEKRKQKRNWSLESKLETAAINSGAKLYEIGY